MVRGYQSAPADARMVGYSSCSDRAIFYERPGKPQGSPGTVVAQLIVLFFLATGMQPWGK